MFRRVPAVGGKKFFARGNRFGLKRRGKGVIPAVHETENGNDADDFDDLVFRPVLAHLRKHFVRDVIGHGARGQGEIQRDALGCGVKRAEVIFPDSGYFCLIDALVKREPDVVHHAGLAARSAADHVSDQAFEAVFDFALRVPDRGMHLCKPFDHLGLARHDQHAVRDVAIVVRECFDSCLSPGVCNSGSGCIRGVGNWRLFMMGSLEKVWIMSRLTA